MKLRAWHIWLRSITCQKPSGRRRFLSRGVEALEVRCLPAVTVSGSATAPILTLTAGDDVVISQNGSNLTYNLGAGAVAFGGALGSVTSLRITCSSSSSSAGNDIQINLMIADGLSGSFRVTVTGNGGPDEIDASGTDFPVSINGGSHNDTLLGGGGDDTLDGSSGNDEIYGGDGDDNLTGNTGNDELYGDGGDDLCLGGDGGDSIFGGDGHDVLNGQSGNDEVSGEDGNDYVYGGAGRDYVDGGDGFDIVKGQGGRDTITGSYEDALDEQEQMRALDSSETHRGVDTSFASQDSRDRNDYMET